MVFEHPRLSGPCDHIGFCNRAGKVLDYLTAELNGKKRNGYDSPIRCFTGISEALAGGRMEQSHRLLFTEQQLQSRVKELGAEISKVYSSQELTVVGLLEDSFIFLADLIRAIESPLTCGFIYVKKQSVGGHTDIHYTSEIDLMGRNVLLVGDIMDTGVTFDYLAKQISSRNPKSLKLCVLIDKPEQRRIDIKPDFAAFQTSEDHIFGYGLGMQGLYRQFPYLAVLQQ